MSDECTGMNYSLRLRGSALVIQPMPLRDRSTIIEVDKMKSIELLRKSVMPPAMIGVICLSLGLILRLAGDELTAVVPPAFRIPLQVLAFAVASVCLMILVARWFFSNLVLRPVDGSPITVRMVPTNSARRFVMLIQGQIPRAQVT